MCVNDIASWLEMCASVSREVLECRHVYKQGSVCVRGDIYACEWDGEVHGRFGVVKEVHGSVWEYRSEEGMVVHIKKDMCACPHVCKGREVWGQLCKQGEVCSCVSGEACRECWVEDERCLSV